MSDYTISSNEILTEEECNIHSSVDFRTEYTPDLESAMSPFPAKNSARTDQPRTDNNLSVSASNAYEISTVHPFEGPMSSAETIGIRELTVGELLLGRQQQLNVLRRLKQRMQLQKLNDANMTAEELNCGESFRRRHQRSLTTPNDEIAKPMTALTLGELYRKSWAQRPAVKRFDANDFIRMHSAEIAKSKNALRSLIKSVAIFGGLVLLKAVYQNIDYVCAIKVRSGQIYTRWKRRILNDKADVKCEYSDTDSSTVKECSLYNLFATNFSYSATETREASSSRQEDRRGAAHETNVQKSSTPEGAIFQVPLHSPEHPPLSTTVGEIPTSQLLSLSEAPLAPEVFHETISWMQRQSELAEQEPFEDYLSATISHLSSGSAFELKEEKGVLKKASKTTKLSATQRRSSMKSNRQVKESQSDEALSCNQTTNDSGRSTRCISNADAPVGRHVAAKRRQKCNGPTRLEASLNLEDPFQLNG
uniref:SANT domain-containing protein n=1 Tax=Ascaris lumbricoides TaxID=6252 RepID=A0A0M3IA03_ASCLU